MTVADPSRDVVIEPLSPALGAVVHGVDARRPLADDVVEHVLQQLYTYKVLFFRNQGLDHAEHCAFARHFGELRPSEFAVAIPGHPGLSELDVVPFFHSDQMQMAQPARFSMLQINQAPVLGGDTMWADLVTSYEDLSRPLREFLESLTGEFSFLRYVGDGSNIAEERVRRHGGDFEKIRQEVQPHDHPLVRTIPETGRSNYWVSKAFTRSIRELNPDESEMLLRFLFAHQLKPQYVIRWRWQDGDIAFWDQRTTLHSGVKDYGDQVRTGQRAAIGVEAPIGPR